MTKRLRVFQVASGNVGTEMVKRMVKHPDLQLVGLHCYSPDKIGRDAGDIVGIGPIGVTATGTIDDILAARPDCLTFHGIWPDMELYERVLEAGINIVTTADWVTATTATPTIGGAAAPRSPRFCRPPACAAIRRSTARA